MQVVDGDQQDVVACIDELHHLAHLTVVLGAQQAAESSHTVVGVYDVVAHLDLSEFAQAQCKLAGACPVASQGVFVETVENLVVGEHACLCLVVHKALVEGAVYGGEGYVVAAVGENLAQAVELAFVFREDAHLVSIGDESGETVGDKVEVLVVYALRTHAHVGRGSAASAFAFGRCGGESELAQPFECIGEIVRGYRHIEGVGIAFAGHECEAGNLCLGHAFHSGQQVRGVAHGHERVGGEYLRKGYVVAGGAHVGGYFHTRVAVFGKLCLDVERAYAVDLVAEEIHAHGKFGGEAVDVKNGTAHGIVARFVHIVGACESVIL